MEQGRRDHMNAAECIFVVMFRIVCEAFGLGLQGIFVDPSAQSLFRIKKQITGSFTPAGEQGGYTSVPQMKEKIAEYGFGDKMSWLGRREDIRQFYNAFDAFLLPSLYEGFPIVGVESQAAGLPVFFSDAITREAGIEELGHFIELSTIRCWKTACKKK
jgi:glycosyltransferase involved in cell wall biosynthesis